MGYLTVLHVRFLDAKIANLHAKDSNSFRNRLINPGRNRSQITPPPPKKNVIDMGARRSRTDADAKNPNSRDILT